MGLNLTLSEVGKYYNGNKVLDRCSVSFDPGVVHILMGPNGSGKSTLLRVAALLEPIDEGAVAFTAGDLHLSHDLSLMRRITLVLPRVGVFNASVYNNVFYGLGVRGVTRDVAETKISNALQAVGLAHKKNENALTLSSGETQRLGIARAMAIEPDILYLDEPTASIDEKNTLMVEDIISGLRRAGGTTIIMTTHDRDQAERLADRVVMMRGGRIVQK